MQGDKTGMTWACDAVVRWDDCYIFKLTFLAHVKFTPHKPYTILSPLLLMTWVLNSVV